MKYQMRSYSQLADLEALLLEIENDNIRAYAGEAIVSYSAGAYRSAIVSIWIAVVYDLYQKFRIISETYRDEAAQKSIERIDKIRNNTDKKQVASWERNILKDASDEVKMITNLEYEHLDRIQQDRHRCAHPVLDSEGLLFQPTPELARTHIRTAIEVLLSQPPIIGKAAGEALEKDVEGLYFPDDIEGVKNFLSGRHFLVGSEKYLANIILLSLKKVLFLDIPSNRPRIIKNYQLVIECLVRNYRNVFESLAREKLSNILGMTKDDRIQNLAILFNIDDRFWGDCPEHIREKFKSFIKEEKAILIFYGIFVLHLLPEIKNDILVVYKNNYINEYEGNLIFIRGLKMAKTNKKESAIFAQEIVQLNIDIFLGSRSYASGRNNGTKHIIPFIPIFTDENIKYLLEKIVKNDQLIDCIFVLKELFQETINTYPDTLPLWKKFYESISIIYKNQNAWSGKEELKQLIDNFPESKQVETETF
ncbi:hypothetical protein [Okeania sp. SIO2B3]|uniref:hypothetical protein n=1 Tax=Okeania sp. SIO2B3 TaxID=2607784 RepID=UPI0013C0BB15|nr:hypothetical protein [Okeania sp. SIO2B3]NET43404.1 hypothetical protein [Okeania sp. SIO2B3]